MRQCKDNGEVNGASEEEKKTKKSSEEKVGVRPASGGGQDGLEDDGNDDGEGIEEEDGQGHPKSGYEHAEKGVGEAFEDFGDDRAVVIGVGGGVEVGCDVGSRASAESSDYVYQEEECPRKNRCE